jgi:hypothetical protein
MPTSNGVARCNGTRRSRLEHPSAARRCASWRSGQRTKTTARRASWFVSPVYYALTHAPFPRALFILSRWWFVPGPPRRTSRSQRGVLAGCFRDILRPATRVRRLGHFARPVSIEDVSAGRLREILGPTTGLRRLAHLARPVRMTTCSPATFGTASRPSARVYRPCSPGITATSSVWSTRHPSQASGSSEPGVEDGGQDKGEAPYLNYRLERRRDFRPLGGLAVNRLSCTAEDLNGDGFR